MTPSASSYYCVLLVHLAPKTEINAGFGSKSAVGTYGETVAANDDSHFAPTILVFRSKECLKKND